MDQKYMIMLAVALVAVYFLFLRNSNECSNDKELTTKCVQKILLDNIEKMVRYEGKSRDLPEEEIVKELNRVIKTINTGDDNSLAEIVRMIGDRTDVEIRYIKDLKSAINKYINPNRNQ